MAAVSAHAGACPAGAAHAGAAAAPLPKKELQ